MTQQTRILPLSVFLETPPEHLVDMLMGLSTDGSISSALEALATGNSRPPFYAANWERMQSRVMQSGDTAWITDPQRGFSYQTALTQGGPATYIGGLPVPNFNEAVAEKMGRLLDLAKKRNARAVRTGDLHPKDDSSFTTTYHPDFIDDYAIAVLPDIVWLVNVETILAWQQDHPGQPLLAQRATFTEQELLAELAMRPTHTAEVYAPHCHTFDDALHVWQVSTHELFQGNLGLTLWKSTDPLQGAYGGLFAENGKPVGRNLELVHRHIGDPFRGSSAMRDWWHNVCDNPNLPDEAKAFLMKAAMICGYVEIIVIYKGGVSTDICMIGTARQLIREGYLVVVVPQVCAGLDPSKCDLAFKFVALFGGTVDLDDLIAVNSSHKMATVMGTKP